MELRLLCQFNCWFLSLASPPSACLLNRVQANTALHLAPSLWLASDLSQITTAQSLAYHRNITITGLKIYSHLIPLPSKDSGKYVYHLIKYECLITPSDGTAVHLLLPIFLLHVSAIYGYLQAVCWVVCKSVHSGNASFVTEGSHNVEQQWYKWANFVLVSCLLSSSLGL